VRRLREAVLDKRQFRGYSGPARMLSGTAALVGATLCVFYLLLLALSEFVGFGAAYPAGPVASVLLIGMYVAGVLRSTGGGFLTALALSGVYGFLYVVLQLEDYSLLIGAAGLFAVLAAIMLATRRTDWYSRDAA
jgi:inner membrane protein